jgi:hypothetical protein
MNEKMACDDCFNFICRYLAALFFTSSLTQAANLGIITAGRTGKVAGKRF